jgi:hypothetical protein
MPRLSVRSLLVIAVSAVSSVLLFALALRDVPLAAVGDALRTADVGWLLLGFFGVFGAFTTRAVRWRGLLDDRLSLRASFHIFNLATAINQLPLRVGEVARAVLASRPGRGETGVPLVTALVSVFIERLLDLLTVALLIAFSLASLPGIPESVGRTAGLAGLGTAAAFVALLVFARFPGVALGAADRLEARVPALMRLGVRRRAEELLSGMRPLTVPGRAAHAVITTVIAWAWSLATFYALTKSLRVDSVYGLTDGQLWQMAALTVPLVAFSIALPVSVAGVGPFQLAVNLGGGVLGMAAVGTAALGILYHGVTVLMYLAFGVIGLWAQGVRLGDVLRRPPEARAETRPEQA